MYAKLHEGYSDAKTWLFFKLALDGTIKLSTYAIKVFVVANMAGEKMLWVIGKLQRPRCFKNVNFLPVCY